MEGKGRARLAGILFRGGVERGEREIGLPAVFILDILNCATPFDATDCEAGAISEAADDAGLPLQRALHCLVKLGWLIEIDDINIAICRRDD